MNILYRFNMKHEIIKSIVILFLASLCSCAKSTDDSAQTKYVFLTRSTFSGNLGGLTGADQKCQAEATSASLSGTYKALISTSSVSAVDRLQKVDYYLLNGVKAITGGSLPLTSNITVFANKGVFNSATDEDDVWTGSNSIGRASGVNCLDWTSSSVGNLGTRGDVDDDLSSGVSLDKSTQTCDLLRVLYCFSE
jgi:hypothetical protein